MKLIGLFLTLTIGLVGVAGCSSSDDYQGGVPANGSTVGAADFAEAVGEPGTTIIDVRTPQEFSGGHIEGARNIDVSAPDFQQQVAGLDRDTPYALYCRSGNRSATALKAMKDMGFKTVYHLDGGVGGWTDSGRPLVN